MSSIESGTVVSVDPRSIGSPVTIAAATDDDTLTLVDNVNFTAGGDVMVFDPATETGTVYQVAELSGDTDLVLTEGLAGPVAEGTWVAVQPAATQTIARVRIADSGEVAPCIVPHGLQDALRSGIRDPETAETVLVYRIGRDYYVLDVVSRATVRDLSNATPGDVRPNAPDNFTVTSLAYVTPDKVMRSEATLDWDAVLLNSDGSDLTNLGRYEIQQFKGTAADTSAWVQATTTDPDTTTIALPGYQPNSVWSFRVRAVTTSGAPGDWSDIATVTMSHDNLPPAQPSAPVATSRLGIISVAWDGKNNSGGAMDADLAYVEVHASTTSTFTPTAGDATTLLDRLVGPGSVLKDSTSSYGTTWYFRLIAVDTSGNASPASVKATAAVKALVDVSNFPDDAAQTFYARTGHFLQLDADNFQANKIEADWCDVGLMTAMLLRGDAIETSASATAGIKLSTANGLRAFDGSNLRTRILGGLLTLYAADGVTETLSLNGTGGKARFSGEVLASLVAGGVVSTSAATTIANANTNHASRVQMRDDGSAGVVEFWTGNASVATPGKINASVDTSTADGATRGRVRMTAPGGGPYFELASTAIAGASAYNAYAYLRAPDVILQGTTNPVTVLGGLSVQTGGLTVAAGGASISGGVTATAAVHAGTGLFDDSLNTGSTTDASIGNSGRVIRTTSSLRFKKNISDPNLQTETLRQIQARRFQRRDEGVGGRYYLGVIAEQIEELGLGDLVWHDEDGLVEGVHYGALAVAALQLAQDAHDRIDMQTPQMEGQPS